MSGNRTKKHNKFDSWIMVPAALPLAERHALENTAFICTDHLLSAMQMLPAIIEDLLLSEKGVEMFLPGGEAAVVVAPLQFITADNARHSEIASSHGAISMMPCRKCVWELKTPARLDGSDYRCDPRSEKLVADMYARYLASGGDKTLLVNVDTGYKLVGGQVLVNLQSFDTMLDCPIELLHTIMLGVGKALQVPILLNQLICSGEIRSDDGVLLIKTCFENLGKLASLSYISKIKHKSDSYPKYVEFTYNDLRLSVMEHDAYMKQKYPNRRGGFVYNSSKMHIMQHLVADIYRFKSPIFYETEKGEQFNKFIRECLFRTNRHNPSRDAAVVFSKRMMVRHVLTGVIETLSSSESCLRHYVIIPYCKHLETLGVGGEALAVGAAACVGVPVCGGIDFVVSEYFKDLGHEVTFYPGEVELKAMTVQLQSQGITDKRLRYNAYGTILCNSIATEAFGENDKGKTSFDHYKAMFGSLMMLRTLARKYKYASFNNHAIRHWSMFTPFPGLYLMNKEQKVDIIKDFERKSEGVIPLMRFTIILGNHTVSLDETMNYLSVLSKEHDRVLKGTYFGTDDNTHVSLLDFVEPVLVRLNGDKHKSEVTEEGPQSPSS
ncbi:hypothetical protein INT47_011948 [Mucor saturninus]|uniref:Uncharacterized protein n=1 Tax=Mucor saturninus TaxID=64648 RepID=A0A8H7V5Z9_9FUNG|nr:hypothetical protein INT47_011948 [Mucor saturninus]